MEGIDTLAPGMDNGSMSDPGGPAGPDGGRKRLAPGAKLTLWAVGGGVAGLVINASYGRFGVVFAAWLAVVVGLVVAVQQVGGPQRPGETAQAFARRRTSLRRWRAALLGFLTASTLAVASFIALVFYAMNSYADNK